MKQLNSTQQKNLVLLIKNNMLTNTMILQKGLDILKLYRVTQKQNGKYIVQRRFLYIIWLQVSPNYPNEYMAYLQLTVIAEIEKYLTNKFFQWFDNRQ